MVKKPKKSKKIGDLDSSFEYKGLPKVRGKTITSHSTMAGYGAYDERNPSPRGKGAKPTKKGSRYG